MPGLSFLKSFLFIALIITLSSGCNENDKLSIEKSASLFDIKQAEASITQSNKNFIKLYKAADSLGVASCYTLDAKVMAAGIPSIEGREDITHFVSESMKKGFKNFDISTIQIWGDSSIVAEEGAYRLSDDSGKPIDKGKYIVLWKQEAGNWKMFRDIWTTDLPDSGFIKKSAAIK
jgi:ketosteroid isomerase-like protein